jgi:filamentous hemagglutinin family protein
VRSGAAEFSHPSPQCLEITTSHHAVIHWDDFSIAEGETTRFVQPDRSSSVLNRVASGNPSALFGTLEANGKVFLINPRGILIGPTGRIDVDSFIASTFDALDADFLRGQELLFSGDSQASVVNLGKITAKGGDVLLISRHVHNAGTLDAPHGCVGLAAGQEILLKPSGTQRFFIRPSLAEKEGTGILQEGILCALQNELRADGNLYAMAIKGRGAAKALSRKESGGRIYLVADQGRVEVDGTLCAERGEVQVLGHDVSLLGTIDVSGEEGGGSVYLGGGFQGKDATKSNARQTVVGETGIIRADARQTGDGGRVIVWADSATGHYGHISASGGAEGGNGGFVEVSGKEYLDYRGETTLPAPCGQTGTLLLDPPSIDVITLGVTSPALPVCPGTLYAPAVAAATVRSADIMTHLATCSLILDTSSSSGDGEITVEPGVGIFWSSSSTFKMTATSKITLFGDIRATGSFAPGVTAIEATAPVIVFGKEDHTSTGGSHWETSTGSIRITAPTSLSLYSGTGGGGAGVEIVTHSPSVADAITISAGTLLLEGGSTGNVRISADSAPMNITTTGDCTLRATTSSAEARFESGGAMTLNIGGSCSLFAGGTDAQISTNSNFTGVVGQDLILDGRTATTADAGGAHIFLFNGSICDLTVGRDLQLLGGSSSANGAPHAGILTLAPGGSTTVRVGRDLVMQGGSSPGAFAAIIGSASIAVTVGRDLQMTAGSGLLYDFGGGSVGSIARISPESILVPGSAGSVNVEAGGGISLAGTAVNAASIESTNPTAARQTVRAEESIYLGGNSYIQTGNGNLLVIADVNLEIDSSSRVTNTGTGAVTIVVDNAFPTLPGIGPGKFILEAGGRVEALGGGPVRIFTARQGANIILAAINGTPFSPGLLFINSSHERWGVYYPSTFFGGPGYTLFYKNDGEVISAVILPNQQLFFMDNPQHWSEILLESRLAHAVGHQFILHQKHLENNGRDAHLETGRGEGGTDATEYTQLPVPL